ncbi:MAG: type IV pilus assembly protein PilM [Planctomycetota bacterium]|jgi:type IV pilus assembly protein PilM
MARVTGVQVTGTTIRVVDVEGTPKKFKVRGFGEATFDASDPESKDVSVVKALREAFKTAKASKEHVILGVPVRDCIIREITVPFTDPEQIKKVIKFESESHLHSCSIDDVVICFLKVAETGNRSTLIVIAAKKAKIREVLDALEKIGVDPLAIDIDASGLFTAVQLVPEAIEQKNIVVCDVGYSSTMITLISEGKVRIVRSVRMGTESITSRVSMDLDIDRAEAHTRTQAILQQDVTLSEDLMIRRSDVEESLDETTKSSNDLERDIVRQRQKELIDRLHQEIYRSINPAKLEEPVDTVFLTGPGSSLPRINADLAESMSLPVKTLDVLGQADHKFSTAEVPIINSAVPTAIGLSMKQLGLDPLRLDFRQEEFVFSKRFDRLKVPLFCLILLLGALNAFAFVLLKTINRAEETKLDRAAKAAASIFQQVADPETIRKKQKEFLTYKPGQLKKIYQGASGTNKDSYSRITYIGTNIRKMHDKLRDDYSLGNSSKSGSKRRSSRNTSKKRNILADPGDYRSALDRMETVMKCWQDVGVREFTLDRLKSTPSKVELGLTIPAQAEIDGKILGFQELLAKFENNLKALPKEEQYSTLDSRGDETHPTKLDFKVLKTLIVEFEKEDT